MKGGSRISSKEVKGYVRKGKCSALNSESFLQRRGWLVMFDVTKKWKEIKTEKRPWFSRWQNFSPVKEAVMRIRLVCYSSLPPPN